MTRLKFEYEFVNKHAKVACFDITDNLVAFRKPIMIWNKSTNEQIKFKTIDELLNYKINDKTVWEIIEPKETIVPIFIKD